jgi:hypothetical protein
LEIEDINGRVMLQLVSKEEKVTVWTEFIWHRIRIREIFY